MTDGSKCRALFLAKNAHRRHVHAAGGASKRLHHSPLLCTAKTFTRRTDFPDLRTHDIGLLSSMGIFVHVKMLQCPEPLCTIWRFVANIWFLGLREMASTVSLKVSHAGKTFQLFANKWTLR